MDLSRLRKSLLTAVGCAAIALAAPLASAWSEDDAGASAATCSSSNLVVWLPSGKGSGAAGSVYYKLRLTNLGTTSCSISGYPAVRALDLTGNPLGKPAAKEAGVKATTVQLAPGASASVQLRVVQPGDFSPADCHPAQAAALRVSPPGSGGAKLVPLPFETCAKPTQTVLSVGPVTKS